jgi:hypothetical protein
MLTTIYPVRCPNCLPGPGKPSAMKWDLVLEPIKAALKAKGCLLLPHWERQSHRSYVRFQYAPLSYQGNLFYLQRWAPVEWAVVPSQLIFPRTGWHCSEQTRRHGSELSLLVRQVIAALYPGQTTLSYPTEVCAIASP